MICNDHFQRNTALQHCCDWLKHCLSIATLCCAKNRRCESSHETPLELTQNMSTRGPGTTTVPEYKALTLYSSTGKEVKFKRRIQ